MATPISETRKTYSEVRLNELRQRLSKLEELKQNPRITIFGAGSYGRQEASKFSDIDMFFLSCAKPEDNANPRTSSLRMFGKLIETIEDMAFPKFSNDCEYLTVLQASDIVANIGSRTDDHENYFTARMLLLLESSCLYGEDVYEEVLKAIIGSYFKDFPDHRETFQPIFLLNDICRFWKTLLLNYENKRKFNHDGIDESVKTKQRVRNFKLKYSRMTTCFASVAALGGFHAPVTEEQVLAISKLTPRERLLSVADRLSAVKSEVISVLEKYEWFLDMTGLETTELEKKFSDKTKRTEMFANANAYGDEMYKLIQAIDLTDSRLRLVRNLVI